MDKKETVKVSLYNKDNANEEVVTSFGTFKFDAKGCAEVDATEEQLEKLQALKWIGEPPDEVKTPEQLAHDAKPRKMLSLLCHAHKGETVNTSFGPITFDAKGMGEHNATEEEAVKLAALMWIFHPQPTMENMEHARAGEKLDGPTIEEFVAAGYLPEEYPPPGYAVLPSAGLDAFKSGGKVPWDAAAVQKKREQQAEDRRIDGMTEEEFAAYVAARDASVNAPTQPLPTVEVAETRAPTPVANDPVPEPTSKSKKSGR